MTATFQRVAALHFATTLAKQNQPDLITLHLDFLRRTSTGKTLFTVKDVKLGRQTSVLHITLTQGSREEVLGYITHSNIATETGVSFETGYKLDPPPPVADLTSLRRCVQQGATEEGSDPNWRLDTHPPFADFRKAFNKIHTFFPRGGQAMPSLADEWITFRSGEKWTNYSLGYICDMWPQVVEQHRISEHQSSTANSLVAAKNEKKDTKGSSDNDNLLLGRMFWYPTLLLNMDVKKRLPEGGVDFLFARVRAKQIKNGRYDLEVVVCDEQGEIVALSHHVALAVSAARNLSSRRKEEGNNSKL